MTARAFASALVSGAALSLAFPEPDLAPLAWIALVPLLASIGSDPRPKRGLALGFAFGLGFFGTLLVWISLVGWVSWAALVVLQAAFIGLFGFALALSWRGGLMARLLAPAALWVAVEYVRSVLPLGGFTWGQLAQSQHNVAWLLKLASLGGAWAIAFVVVLANALMAEAWRRRGARSQAGAFVGVALVVVAIPAALPTNSAGGRAVRVAIVQGSLPSGPTARLDRQLAIVRSHARLTKKLAGSDVDLVVWPESSVGIDPERVAEAGVVLAGAARAVDAPMIVGGNLYVDPDHYLVVALEVAPTGAIVDRYQKTHLVPFGEYVPARKWLDWLPMLDQVPRDAIPGTTPKLFDVAGGRVAPVISYEGDFGSLVRERIALGGRLLVVATNTSTWGRTWASAQHVAFSQVRAAENGVWVAHAALTGISAFVAPDGGVHESTPLWTDTSIVRDVRFANGASFYARTGDWLAWLSLIASVAVIGWGLVSRRRAGTVRR